jgi:regulatory protein
LTSTTVQFSARGFSALLASPPPCLYASLVRSRSKPRQLSTEQELYASALRALMRRAHSIHQMKEYLTLRAEDKDLVANVIARLRELNYLDDASYAAEFARQHAQFRKQGRFRIARELRTRGVPDRHIDDALDSVFAETDESASVRARIKRKLAHARGAIDQRKIASLYRILLRAGFSSDIIRAELRGITQGDLPELPGDPD